MFAGSEPRFRDRRDAGRTLAENLESLRGSEPLVLAMVRGGVPVAAEIAESLAAPLFAWPVTKIGAPQQPEYALGAVGPGGVTVWNEPAVERLEVSAEGLNLMREKALHEVERRAAEYGQPARGDLEDRIVVLVDDGLATGLTMRAALAALRSCAPSRIVVAVPLCAPRAGDRLGLLENESLVCACEAELHSVGAGYRDFEQVADAEVLSTLEQLGPH